MRIVVCVKQVPGLADTPMDEAHGVLVRTGEKKINPYDLTAIETALRIREICGGTVCALTMGPEASAQVVRTAMAMGVDEGCMLCDGAFAGADVLVTAKTLAAGIAVLGGADLVICGQQTTDGDTAQVPFSLAVQLGIPSLGWIRALEIFEDHLICHQELTGRTYTFQTEVPLVLAVESDCFEARSPGLRAKLSAGKKAITRLTPADLEDKNPAHYGLKASPTRVVKLFSPENVAKQPSLTLTPQETAALLFKIYRENREETS